MLQLELVFDALADRHRREMVHRLARHGHLTTNEVTENLGMSRQGARRHLEVLESAGVVGSERKGREVVRYLNPEPLNELRNWVTQVESQWESALQRLEASYHGQPDEPGSIVR
ncbi:MAG: metalloregulator ArsR/SmtB family transcription factor [Armatimonadetes bacterium]|nr:metalloregulator ArsR/SmtB family transcription factor [Armatimonadota bacterium]